MQLARAGALICLIALGVPSASMHVATAKAPTCPAAYELADLPELEAFVEAAGGMTGAELTAFFELVDENDDGLICFKTLPQATPLPTPPLLASDNRVPKAA